MDANYTALDPAAVSMVLEDHGISATRQRREIARLLLGKAQHVTAEQLMDALANRGYCVSKATVYNTLKLFVERGLLREVHADATRTVYDTMTAPHHHFLDVDTGELHDIEPGAVSFAELPEPPDGMVANGVDVIVRVCSRKR